MGVIVVRIERGEPLGFLDDVLVSALEVGDDEELEVREERDGVEIAGDHRVGQGLVEPAEVAKVPRERPPRPRVTGSELQRASPVALRILRHPVMMAQRHRE